MIRVLFFARLREQLGCSAMEVACGAGTTDLAALRAELCATSGWKEVLTAPNVLCAVNQQQVDLDHPLVDGDEVAFFPPVTGG